jgi:hypothetical protein
MHKLAKNFQYLQGPNFNSPFIQFEARLIHPQKPGVVSLQMLGLGIALLSSSIVGRISQRLPIGVIKLRDCRT